MNSMNRSAKVVKFGLATFFCFAVAILFAPINACAQTVTVAVPCCSSVQITTYNSGDTVNIVAVLNTTDPDESGEGEPLQLGTSDGEFTGVVSSYGLSQALSFTATASGTLFASILNSEGDESGSVTVTVVPQGGKPPVKKYSAQDKLVFRQLALKQGLAGLGLQAAVGVCAFFTPCATAVGALALSAVFIDATLLGGSGLLVGDLVNDPSDPNFMTIAQPFTPTITLLAVQPGVTQSEADVVNAFAQNQAEIAGYATAIITSINRAQGASDVGNNSWEQKQLAAADRYNEALAVLLAEQPLLLGSLQSALTAAGFPPLTISAVDVFNVESDIAFHGLPPSSVQVFTQLGLDSATIGRITQFLLAADVNAAAGTFPAALTDPALLSAIQQVATSQIHSFDKFRAKLEIEPDELRIDAKFRPGLGSDRIDPHTQAVTLHVGSFITTIPANSFRRHDEREWEFNGRINGIRLEVEIKKLDENTFHLDAEAKGPNMFGRPVPVSLNVGVIIGKDGGVTTASDVDD